MWHCSAGGHTLRTTQSHSLEDNPTSLDPFACAGPAQQMAFLAEIVTLSLLTELTFSKHPPIYNWNALPEKKTQCLTASHWLLITFEGATQTPSCAGPLVTWPLTGLLLLHTPQPNMSHLSRRFLQVIPLVTAISDADILWYFKISLYQYFRLVKCHHHLVFKKSKIWNMPWA